MTSGASAFPDRLKSVDLEAGKLDAGPAPVLLLVGPSTFPRPVFESSLRKLRDAGALVVPPVGPEPAAADEWRDWMRYSVRYLSDADGVAVLPASGGLRSAGILCGLAHDLAIPVRTVPGWLTQLGQIGYMGRLLAGREAGEP